MCSFCAWLGVRAIDGAGFSALGSWVVDLRSCRWVAYRVEACTVDRKWCVWAAQYGTVIEGIPSMGTTRPLGFTFVDGVSIRMTARDGEISGASPNHSHLFCLKTEFRNSGIKAATFQNYIYNNNINTYSVSTHIILKLYI